MKYTYNRLKGHNIYRIYDEGRLIATANSLIDTVMIVDSLNKAVAGNRQAGFASNHKPVSASSESKKPGKLPCQPAGVRAMAQMAR